MPPRRGAEPTPPKCRFRARVRVVKTRTGNRFENFLFHFKGLENNGNPAPSTDLKKAQALVNELKDFRANFTDAGNATFGACVQRHDDLVLATGIAAWHTVQSWEQRVVTKRVKVLG